MDKILVIAEKPSVARDIARVLKCDKKGEGFLFSDTHIVSWAIGHLVTLYDPEDYDATLKKWRADALPIIPPAIQLKPVAKTRQQLTVLKKLMADKSVVSLICATDSGREGELIFRYIYTILKSRKPFQRLWISSMTDQAIREGFANLRDSAFYDPLYYSAQCRSEADWLVGINASRAYTIRYNALLSIGRVQTPTLAILVARQKEINAFVPQDYWEVAASFESYKGRWFDPDTRETKLSDKEKAEAITEKVKGQTAIVAAIEKEEKKQLPPLLYDLTELQRDGNKKFGFSASKTLSIAQDLYEKRKMITYPRTDSRYLSHDMKEKVLAALKKLHGEALYAPFINPLLALSALPFNKRILDDTKITDHHAIIPTDGRVNLGALSPDERKIFDLVARRLIAVFYPAYLYHVTKITTVAEGEHFLTRGMTVAQLGYMALYQEETKPKKGADQELETVLPDVSEGDRTTVLDAVTEKKKTTPPKAYHEAALLSAMENAGRFVEDEEIKEQLKDAGLGTPATRAAIIERLIAVRYVERKGKNLIPTEKGMNLIAVVPPEMASPETTGKWERGLAAIAKGTMQPERFMASIHRYVRYLVTQSSTGDSAVTFVEEKRSGGKSLGHCPLCADGAVFENSKAYFCNRWKNGCKFTLWKNSTAQYGCTLDHATVKKLLKNKKVPAVPLVLPQTGEKCVADLVFKENGGGAVVFVNLSRADTTKKG